jgi:hypothetical protein
MGGAVKAITSVTTAPVKFTGGLIKGALQGAGISSPESAPYATDYSGRPTYPGYESYLTAGGNLPANLQQQSFLDTQALEEMRRRSLSTTPSAWASLSQEKQGLEQAQLLEQARQQALQGTAQAQTQLAMKGGLRSGAAERIARGGAENLMRAGQQVSGAGAMARQNILLQEEQNKLGLLQAQPGMETQAAGAQSAAQQANINAMITAYREQEAAKMQEYQAAMQAWAAAKQAEGTAASAPKKGLLGSILG